MGRYRKIDTRIWNDAKFSALSDDAKLLFLFVLTHPNMTSLGAMRCTPAGLAAEIRWLGERLPKAFREALTKGLLEYDDQGCLVALPNFLRYNGPESPNVIKAWAGSVDLLPECHLKTKTLQRVKAFAEGLPKAFAEAFRQAFAEALAKAMPNQEQEQEQKQEYKEQITTLAALQPACAVEVEQEIESETNAALTEFAAPAEKQKPAMLNEDAEVFRYLREHLELTPKQVAMAGKLIFKANGSHEWSPHKLGILMYSSMKNPRPECPVTYAVALMRGKAAAEDAVDRYVQRAAAILRGIRSRIAAAQVPSVNND